MFDDILQAANLYDDGLKRVLSRREQWLSKHAEIRDHLKEIASYLNDNAAYKQVFYVDSLHAFDEVISGTCTDMPSITFRSGDMPMEVTFRNTMGEKKEFIEEGFRITFNPTITGQIIILLVPHHSELSKGLPPYATLAIIDQPEQITNEIINQVIREGIKGAFTSSFTGMQTQDDNNDDNTSSSPTPPVPQHNVIGFKRYETTEKVK